MHLEARRSTMRSVKLALLAISLVWLAAWGVVGALHGVLWWALIAYALVVVIPAGIAGCLGLRGGRVRFVAAAFVVALLIVLAWVTFSDLRLLVGLLGVLVSILLPARGSEAPGQRGSTVL